MDTRSYVETLGLDINRIDPQGLSEIAAFLEEEIKRSLSFLSGRRSDYEIVISVGVKSDHVEVVIDLRLESPEPLNPEFESLLDQAIDNALESLRDELLRRYGGAQEPNL